MNVCHLLSTWPQTSLHLLPSRPWNQRVTARGWVRMLLFENGSKWQPACYGVPLSYYGLFKIEEPFLLLAISSQWFDP